MKVKDRLSDWRVFRKTLQYKDENCIIEEVLKYWSKKPLVNFVLNYNDYKNWPTPWELISEDYFDSICIAYLMMETFISLDIDRSRFELRYIKPDLNSEYIMILILDNSKVFNYSYNDIYDIKDISYINCLIKIKYINENLIKV